MKTLDQAFLGAIALTLVATPPARALIPGGGPAQTDCFAAWQVTTQDLVANKGKTGVDCQEGDPKCDVDATQNGVCVFGVSVCLGQTGVTGCTPQAVTAVKLNKKAQQLGLTLPGLPALAPACGTGTAVTVALRRGKKGFKASKPVKLQMTADSVGKDKDKLQLRCVPNTGAGLCPDNAAGGPADLALTVAATGSDLDNGWTGQSQNFPITQGATLRMCLSGCDARTNPSCVEDQASTDQVKTPTFGPPLPLFSAGVPVCIVNRFDTPNLTNGTANVQTGEITGDLHLLSDVYLTSATTVCPRCSGNAIGKTGNCDSGRRAGQTCRTEGILEVTLAPGNKTFTLSADCPPEGSPAGTLTIVLPLTAGTSMLNGPNPCGATSDDSCGTGTCDQPCTGLACASTVNGECVDVKGGISQVCCSTDTTKPCFPTKSGAGAIVRTGSTAPPDPAWPDAAYPKTGNTTLVATFCEAASGSNLINTVTGLPGPGAIILPATTVWSK